MIDCGGDIENEDMAIDLNYKPALPKEPRPIVILGAGGIVKDAHLPAYGLAGFPVHGIYNRTRHKAELLAGEFEIPRVYDSVEQAVADAPANAVFDIALMPPQFVPTLEQLPDESAVLIQKPMGDDWPQGLEILQACRKRKLRAAINCQLRYAPFVAAARDMIQRGLIGDLYDMEVRVCVSTPWHLFTNVIELPRLEIQQHSVHYVDLIRSFLGDPTGVMAKTVGHPASDLASTRTTICMDYGDKLRATIATNHDHSFGDYHQESFIKWEGTQGAIKAQFGLLKNYPHGESDTFEYCLKSDEKSGPWQSVELEGSWFPDAFVGTMANLMCFIEGSSAELPTSVEDVIRTMACVEAAYRSSASSGELLPTVN